MMTRDLTITCAPDLLSVEETSPPCIPPATHQPPCVDRVDHASIHKTLSEGGDSGQGPTEDDHETLTACAIMALTFRLANSQASEAMKPVEEPLSISYRASCSHTQAATQSVLTAGMEDVFQDPDEKLRKRAQKSLRIHEMLCSVPPSIIDNTTQSVLEDVLKGNVKHSILYNYRRIPHTIVLDSLHPDLAPNIVITPPPDTWEDLRPSYDNRINPQNMTCLFVPPFYLSTCRIPTYEEWQSIVCPPPQAELHPQPCKGAFDFSTFCLKVQRAQAERSSLRTCAASLATDQLLRRYLAIAASRRATTFCRRYLCEYIDSNRNLRVDPKTKAHPRVFSPSSFQTFVEHTRDERIHPMTQAAVSVTHRLLIRLEAIRASSIAAGWRSLYDDPQFLASVEKRFRWKWNDPAEPIFSHLGPRPVNVTIIHSAYPCTAPHIVIHGTEPNDPWIAWGNATDVQDCSYGNALVVVSARGVRLTYVNTIGDESDDYLGDIGTCDYDDFGYSSDSSSSFSSISSSPQTPAELERIGSGFFSEVVEEDLVKCRYESYSSYISGLHEDIASPSPGNSYSHNLTSGHTSSGKFYFADDDEEADDGLPEYDEWFTSIANRTKIAEGAEPLAATPI